MEDEDLVRAAQAGDAGALGVLLAQHDAGMRAVAVSILGYGPDAEDAVQDAMLTAVRRIGEVRDPAAAGAWLRAVVRNNCRTWQRARRPLLVGDPELLPPPSDASDPAQLLDRAVLEDWVWHAVDGLSEVDRLVTVLRYFSGVTSYENIAKLCGIPVGTVRSRLSHARRTLADRLRATADAAHPDASARAEARSRQAREALTTAMNGDWHRIVEDFWLPDAEMIAPGGVRGGPELAIRGMAQDLADGVRQRLTGVAASRDVLIWETELISPSSDPEHCPPGALWLHQLDEGRVRRMTLFHLSPPESELPAE